MVKLTKGSDVYEFGYDGLNRRISETKNGSLVKRFVWDELALAEERDASNVITKRFLPQGEIQGTASYFYTRDHLGSVRELTGSDGGVAASYGYDAGGRRSLLSGTDLASFGYTGHYSRGGGDLVMAPFRSYDPEVGRWISRDLIGESDGFNLYEYVGNNPINFIDPLGLSAFIFIISNGGPLGLKDLGHVAVGVTLPDGKLLKRDAAWGSVGPLIEFQNFESASAIYDIVIELPNYMMQSGEMSDAVIEKYLRSGRSEFHIPTYCSTYASDVVAQGGWNVDSFSPMGIKASVENWDTGTLNVGPRLVVTPVLMVAPVGASPKVPRPRLFNSR
jgi:RHS repeat-associated protein